MLKCTYKNSGVAPLGFSAPVVTTRRDGEDFDDYENRIWRERMHADAEGNVFLPQTMLSNCLSAVAKQLSEKIRGKGMATWTKHFERGILVVYAMRLGFMRDELACQRLFVPSDGRRGGGSRVWKNFPVVPEWSCDATLYAVDPQLEESPKKIEEYLGWAGKLIGFGFFRPACNGHYGRFRIENFKAVKVSSAEAA